LHYLYDRYLTVKSVTLVVLDVLVVAGSTSLAIYLRLHHSLAFTWSRENYAYPILLIIVVHMVVLYYHDLYALRQRYDSARLFVLVTQSVAIASLLLFVLYFAVPPLAVGRGIFLINMFLLPPLLTGTRVIFMWLARREVLQQRVAVLGEADEIEKVWHRLQDSDNYRVVGCVLSGDPADADIPEPLGPIEDLKDLVVRRRVDSLIVAMRERRGRLPLQDLLYLKLIGVEVENQATFVERVTGRVPVAGLPPSNLVFSDGFKRITIYQRMKFLPDFVAALTFLILCAPLMLIIAVLVRLDSRGPALFRQQRVGRAGETFQILKFRTMREDAEKTGAQFAQENDPRITRIGRFLRKTRLDELPQLLNVVRGEMSFVGPRPERPEFVANLQEEIPYYYLRTVIRPGITGWAQIRYPYGETTRQHREKLEHDLYYIKNMSLALDTLIALDTLRVILFGHGSR
jgi:sugar transferase (PEP-CTERM system associated)